MKKEFTLAALLLIFSLNVFSQAPDWEWAKSAGGTNEDHGQSTATDASGNVYTTGYFWSSSLVFGSDTLINAGGYDIFVVKYSSSGNVLWAKRAGGISSDAGQSISTDASGNVYVTGNFWSSFLVFGSDTLISAGERDIFVVKYSPSGNVLWARRAGGTDHDDGQDISTDASGNVYVTGNFQSPSLVFASDTLTSGVFGYPDIFIVKYSPSGNELWAKSAGGLYNDYGRGISTDASGNVYVTGSFDSPSIVFGSDTLTNGGGYHADIFVVKYSTSGNELWAIGVGGTNENDGMSTSTDASGNVYVTGYFWSSYLVLGSDTLTNASAGSDIFVVKYSASGIMLWARRAGGASSEYGNDISTDASGNVYVTGNFFSSSVVFGTDTLTNAGVANTDIFVVKYSASGNVLWANSAGGIELDYGQGISIDASGNVYITGNFQSPSIVFGPDTLTNSGSWDWDIFVARLDSASVTSLSEIKNSGSGIFVFPNPVKNELRVSGLKLEVEKVELFDMVGERCFTLNPTPRERDFKIDVSGLAAGIYFVKVSGKEFSVARKFVKQ